MKRGLVLSGGAGRGFAHAGVLRALEEQQQQFHLIAGVSIGAVVGALYADGNSADHIFQIFKDEPLSRLMKIKLSSSGLFQSEGLRQLLQKHLKATTFEELKIPLKITATNYSTGKLEVFESGPLLEPIMASSAIPLLFHAIKIGEHHYIDGGILSNLPAHIIRAECDHLTAININPIGPAAPPSGLFDILLRTLQLGVHANIHQELKEIDLLIEPAGMSNYSMFDLSKGKEMYELGYQYARTFLNQTILKA